MCRVLTISARHSIVVVLLLVVSTVVPVRTAFAGSVSEFTFDCTSTKVPNTYSAIGRTLIVPEGFQNDPSNRDTLILPSSTQTVDGGRLFLNIVAISYAESDSRLYADWENHYALGLAEMGIELRINTTELPLNQLAYQAVLIAGDEQLVITSIVAIDWPSFLQCIIG